MIAQIDRVLAQTGSLRAVAVLRIAAGPIVLLHLSPFLARAIDGHIPGDSFIVPFAYAVPPRAVYLVLLWLTVPAAIAMSAGAWTRAVTAYTTAFVAFNLFLSQTHFHHNRAFLLIVLAALTTLRCGDHLSIDARRRAAPAGPAPLWPLWLLRFEVVVMYTASGLSKLIDDDWFGGTVLRLRVEQWRSFALGRGVPGWALDVLSDPGFMAVFAKLVVLTELFIGLGLVWRRTRLAAVWVAIPFHVAIQLTASVQVFSWLALAALVIWVTPSDHDRVLTVPRSHPLRRAVRWFDWTGRFRLTEGPLTLVDRDGAPATRPALLTLTRLPATFWVAAPLRIITPRRSRTGT